jgi:hypothetical protein
MMLTDQEIEKVAKPFIRSVGGYSQNEPDIRKRAMMLYKPPFKFQHGYIHDSENRMVADDGDIEGEKNVAARVRGWGRISYLPDPEKLQDEVGQMLVDALNLYYKSQGQL